MDEREKLLEQYDDAAFALMMDECAEKEGAAFLAEFRAAAEAGELPEFPEDLDRACRTAIDREYSRREWKIRLRHFRRSAAKAAVVVFALIGLVGTLIMSVEALRIPIVKFVLKDFGIYSEFLPIETTCAVEDMEEPLAYVLPDEYVKIYDDVNDYYDSLGGYDRFICYTAGEDMAKLSITVQSENGKICIDTEDAVVSTIEIMGQECFLIEKKGYQLVWVWMDCEKKYFFSFYASAIDKEQFLEMADCVVQWCDLYAHGNARDGSLT